MRRVDSGSREAGKIERGYLIAAVNGMRTIDTPFVELLDLLKRVRVS